MEVFSGERFISYFVEGFPDGWNPDRLFQEIARVEPVVDVYIPNKRTKGGRRFGFAKFVRCGMQEDKRWNRLNSLLDVSRSIRFNVARFPQQKQNHVSPSRMLQTKANVAPVIIQKDNLILPPGRDERSYAEALLQDVTSEKETPVVKISTNHYPKEWLFRSAVGTLREGRADRISLPAEVGIKNMGGNLRLVTFASNDIMRKELTTNFSFWVERFSDFHPWRPKDVNIRRLCWVKIIGIPFNAWQEDAFRKIIHPIGSLLQVHKKTTSLECLEAAYIHIITSCLTEVKKTITVEIDGKNFQILVMEERAADIIGTDADEKTSVSVGCTSALSPVKNAFSPGKKICFVEGEKTDLNLAKKGAGSNSNRQKREFNLQGVLGLENLNSSPTCVGQENNVQPIQIISSPTVDQETGGHTSHFSATDLLLDATEGRTQKKKLSRDTRPTAVPEEVPGEVLEEVPEEVPETIPTPTETNFVKMRKEGGKASRLDKKSRQVDSKPTKHKKSKNWKRPGIHLSEADGRRKIINTRDKAQGSSAPVICGPIVRFCPDDSCPKIPEADGIEAEVNKSMEIVEALGLSWKKPKAALRQRLRDRIIEEAEEWEGQQAK